MGGQGQFSTNHMEHVTPQPAGVSQSHAPMSVRWEQRRGWQSRLQGLEEANMFYAFYGPGLQQEEFRPSIRKKVPSAGV